MKMKSKLLFVPLVMAIMSATTATTTTKKPTTTTKKPTTTTPKTTTTTRWTTTTKKPTTTTKKPTTTTRWTTTTPRWRTTTPWTTGHPAVNLDGKMFTLSLNGGDISLYPPNYSPPQPRPSTTRHYYYTTTPYPWTTQPPTRGLSVCLRFLTDFVQSRNPRIFTLSPSSSNPLTLGVSGSYWLSYDRYRYANVYLQPSIRFWSEVAPDIWTRVCITLDSFTNVVQLFSGSYMSIRKLLPVRYSWAGEPVITFSGFDGQVTDVQVWDYPLRYREVIDYMNPSAYKLYRGSVLTWSYISYSLRGNPLLEDVYEIQAQQLVSRKGRRRGPKGEKKTRRVFSMGESKDREKQQL